MHLEIRPGEVEHNRFLLVEAIKQAVSGGADWIVSPELAVCGLQFPRLIGVDWILPQPDRWVRQLCRLMREVKRTLFVACPERDGRTLYNSVFVTDSRGEIVGTHRKINVVSDALSWSSPGGEVAPIHCDGINVGVMVCSDAYTADIARALKMKGAQLLISPTSWGPGLHGPQGEWEERTRETGLPLIVANRTGAETSLDFWNAPSLVVKNGERVLAHTSNRSVILMCDWNFTTMMPVSTTFHSLTIRA